MKANRAPLLAGLLFGVGVAAPKAIEEGKPIWIQIAKEGVFKGHPSSPEGATFTREFFGKIIVNFHRDPAYKAGADGVGTEHVVPTDYEHASELDPTSGSIPQSGAPSPAWVMELQIRDSQDGRAELWALTDITSKTLREQLNSNEYLWTSIAVWPNAKDPVSGERIGPLMTSFAFTNHPFIQGMHAIAASAWVSRAESREELVVGLRDLFQLSSEATPEQVSAELEEFASRLVEGTLPDSLRATDVIDRLRSLLGVRLLATNDEVIEAARQMLASTGYVGGDTTPGEPNMPLSTKLATLLKCSDSEESIMKFSQEKVAAADALQQLQDMFGSKDTQSLIKAAAEQIAAAEKVKGLVEALQAASGTVGQMDEAQAAAETDAVVSSMVRDIPDVKAREATAGRIRPGVLAARKACLVEQDLCGVKFKRVDEKKLEQFRATYPLPPAELSLLTQRVFAGPGGQQMRLTADPQGNIQQTTLPAAAREPDANDRHAKVRHLAGRNDTERAMTLLAKERPGYASMDRLDQVEIAGQWLRGETD